MSQITVGYAAFHGLLEDAEAKAMLKACLPDEYPFAFAKRMTPVFAVITDEPTKTGRILPCNVPASMFHFGHALKRYGMDKEARDLLLPIYSEMLERGATDVVGRMEHPLQPVPCVGELRCRVSRQRLHSPAGRSTKGPSPSWAPLFRPELHRSGRFCFQAARTRAAANFLSSGSG